MCLAQGHNTLSLKIAEYHSENAVSLFCVLHTIANTINLCKYRGK